MKSILNPSVVAVLLTWSFLSASMAKAAPSGTWAEEPGTETHAYSCTSQSRGKELKFLVIPASATKAYFFASNELYAESPQGAYKALNEPSRLASIEGDSDTVYIRAELRVPKVRWATAQNPKGVTKCSVAATSGYELQIDQKSLSGYFFSKFSDQYNPHRTDCTRRVAEPFPYKVKCVALGN